MSIAEDHNFVIQSDADALLSQLSTELSNLILNIASRSTANKSADGTPLVTVGDIQLVSRTLADVLDKAIADSRLPANASTVSDHLRKITLAASDD